MGLKPDWAEQRLVVVKNLSQKGLPGDGLVLKETLEEHGDFETLTALHELTDEETKVGGDVVCLQHVDRQAHNINRLNLRVSVKDGLSDLQADFFDAKINRRVPEDVVGNRQRQLKVTTFHITEVGRLIQENKTVLELLSRAESQSILSDSHQTGDNWSLNLEEG